jgi:hypothetical protein
VFVQFNLQIGSKYRDDDDFKIDDNHEDKGDDNDEEQEGQKLSENIYC